MQGMTRRRERETVRRRSKGWGVQTPQENDSPDTAYRLSLVFLLLSGVIIGFINFTLRTAAPFDQMDTSTFLRHIETLELTIVFLIGTSTIGLICRQSRLEQEQKLEEDQMCVGLIDN